MTEDELLQVIERAAKEDLQSLDLSNNQLSSLPQEIGKLTSLQLLDLSNNQLSSLPQESASSQASSRSTSVPTS